MHRPSRRGVGLLVAVVVPLLLSGTALAGNATGITITVPNSKAAITGQITRHGGGAVKNALVELIDPGFGYPSDYSYTDGTGKFTFYDKTDATFLIAVDPHPGAPTYEPGYYRKTDPDHFTPASSSATEVHYTGALIGGINVAVRLGHSIKGRVHRQKNGAPLESITVRSLGSSFSSSAVTDGSGNYAIQGLSNGSVQLSFTPPTTVNILSGCYRNAPPHNYTAECSGNASSITVNNADVLNKDVDLPDGHLITGKVQDADGHNLCASVSATSLETFVSVSQTTACGSFTLIGVPSGDYRIGVLRHGSSHFVNGSYATNAHHWTATGTPAKVHVGKANVSLVTIQPDTGYTVGGTIKNGANQGVPNAAVSLQGQGGSYDSVSTDAHGNFTFFGVGAGTHTISEDAYGSGQNLLRGYYRSGATGNWTANDDQATALSANANHGGIVIKPPKGYSISGRITNAAHDGVSSIVTANGATYGFAFTDQDGNYVMNGLEPGSYTVEVSPGSSPSQHYRRGYYDKTAPGHFGPSYTDATAIDVGP